MQERYSAKEYRELISRPEIPAKYHNQKTIVNGIMFDSKKEADYFIQLNQLKKAGEIVDFFCQVPFLIQEGYYKPTGEWVRPVYYKADFMVLKYRLIYEILIGDGEIKGIKIEIHEVKGFKKNRVWEIKRKMFENKYPEYKLIII